MKVFSFFCVVLAMLVLIMGGTSAAPEPKGIGKIIRKGGKVIKHGLTAIGVGAAGHEVYQDSKNSG
uniref:Moricin B3 n=2 Tax=Bombyx TaxID=7090 RepID=G3D628_BOMMO|nr:moricin B3 [Bombyx mori]AEM66428.1 moricin B3 [Bombyx mandarina]AEM66423.1 moricin B3 [Bombyx mori]AEM66424.1 moricin B3 [Bombyx mori]AEM66425.1 moricin B3 [Bombyx mori]